MHERDIPLLDEAFETGGVGKHGERFLLATGSVTISPPAWVTAFAMRPPAVATRALAPARVSASAISMVACSLPPVSRRGTTCNMVSSAMG